MNRVEIPVGKVLHHGAVGAHQVIIKDRAGESALAEKFVPSTVVALSEVLGVRPGF